MEFNDIKFEKPSKYGRLYSIDEWIELTSKRFLINYDGNGTLVHEDYGESDLIVLPSFVKNGKITKMIRFDDDQEEDIYFSYEDDWNFTHVMWYNNN